MYALSELTLKYGQVEEYLYMRAQQLQLSYQVLCMFQEYLKQCPIKAIVSFRPHKSVEQNKHQAI